MIEALARRFLLCPGCNSPAKWVSGEEELVCPGCAASLSLRSGVVFYPSPVRDEVTDFYDSTGGPRFVDCSFADDMRIHCSTRRYRQCLSSWSRGRKDCLLDLGCGDGRMSLAALEEGFESVVAVDSTGESLQRLSHEAERRGLRGLLPVCLPLQNMSCLQGPFDCILLIEVIGYFLETQQRLDLYRNIGQLLENDGRFLLAEFTKYGRMLSDVVAMNLENMRTIAYQGRRKEKDGMRFSQRSIETAYSEPAAMRTELQTAGFEVLAEQGVSPIPLLFHHAYQFTSYPLRSPLDEEMQNLIETLDDQTSEVSGLSRNIVFCLKKKSPPV